MFVIIAGGGRTGAQLATLLLGQNHQVSVIEHRIEILAHLHRELPTEVIVEGDATDPLLLEQAGIAQADVLAACTPSDADNLVLCYLARTRYQVTRTIAQINSPRSAWLFDKKFGVDVALNQSQILASLIEEEMSLGDMMTLLKLRRGAYSLVEEKVPVGAKAVGMAIKDLALPEECVIAAIMRRGKMIVPRGITILEVGDEVLAVTDRPGADQLAALLSAPSNNHQTQSRATEPEPPAQINDPGIKAAPKRRSRKR
jgi:trk system potassium uptake protein TrkA